MAREATPEARVMGWMVTLMADAYGGRAMVKDGK